jgi:hypothetical protein
MKALIVRFANRAHRQASPWKRRPAIVVAVMALALNTLLFWLLLPLMIPLYLAFVLLKAVVEAIAEMPSLTINQATSDWADWQRNLAGALRIWQAPKAA